MSVCAQPNVVVGGGCDWPLSLVDLSTNDDITPPAAAFVAFVALPTSTALRTLRALRWMETHLYLLFVELIFNVCLFTLCFKFFEMTVKVVNNICVRFIK